MIKDCRVLINNDAVTVVKFGEEEVQLPAIRTDEKTVRVAFENGKYKVVGKDYVEKAAEKKVEKPKEDKPKTEEDKPEKAEETTEKKIEKKESGFKPFSKK